MAFSDFPEQQASVELLQRSLERNRLAHAYLFTGTDIHQLELVARTLAKTLNCGSPRRGASGAALDSCDACSNCRRIDNENHPDVSWLRPESKSRIIEVEQTRDLIQLMNLKPSVSSFKVAVISSADRMTPPSANAFLKTLEEPPPRSILILLTTEPQRLLETIVSRCLRLNFPGDHRLPEQELAWVESFARMAAQPDAGLLGRYRLLGTLIGRLAEQKDVIRADLEARSPLSRIEDIDPKQRERLEEELEAAVEAEYRRRRGEALLSLQLWLRDVWLKSAGAAEALLTFSMLTDLTGIVARRVSPDHARENLQVIEETYRLLTTNVQEALALEVGFIRLKL